MSKNIQEGILTGRITSYKNDLIFSNKSSESESLVDTNAQQLRLLSNIEKMQGIYKDASTNMLYQNKLIKDEKVNEREMSLDELMLDMEFL